VSAGDVAPDPSGKQACWLCLALLLPPNEKAPRSLRLGRRTSARRSSSGRDRPAALGLEAAIALHLRLVDLVDLGELAGDIERLAMVEQDPLGLRAAAQLAPQRLDPVAAAAVENLLDSALENS
jgi:hypothetical protein